MAQQCKSKALAASIEVLYLPLYTNCLSFDGQLNVIVQNVSVLSCSYWKNAFKTSVVAWSSVISSGYTFYGWLKQGNS